MSHAASIPVCDEPVAAAHRLALERGEPVFVPAKYHVDDRGSSLMNLLTGVLSPQGQVNFSSQNPGVIKAWHRHARQTDFWLCLQGHLQAGVHREGDSQSWTLVVGERNPGIVIVPPSLWHGAATIGHVPAGLLYYVTHAYDPKNPDEQRRAYDSVAGFAWGTRHR